MIDLITQLKKEKKEEKIILLVFTKLYTLLTIQSFRYRFSLGCLPAIIICGVDILLCSYYGVSSLCGLLANIFRNLIRSALSPLFTS